MHNLPFNLIAIIAGIHIAMNWSWIVSVFKKRVNISKQNNTLLSPKMLTMIMRSFIIVLSSGIVAVMLYSIVGKPALERIYKQNDIIRFTPTLGHGLLQFFGEAFLIAVYAFVARKWLRIRL